MIVVAALLLLQIGTQPGAARLEQRADTTRADVVTLVSRARAARLQLDSMLGGYEAEVRQRLSAAMGVSLGRVPLGPVGRDRLAARVESVARVGWSQEHGAWGEILASRSVAPIIGEIEPSADAEDVALVLPYYPGRERLWPMGELRNVLPGHDDWIAHPLEPGADSIYTFSLGDSLRITLPGGTVVRVHEIRVKPRRPADRYIVGSLWVDMASGSLVRAAYRPSVPMDLWPFIEREVGRNDRDKVKRFGPFTGTVREIIVDHGLYEGRFWLPRTRMASADGTGTGGRIVLSVEQSFRYDKVFPLPAGELPRFLPDTVKDVDPRTGRVRAPKWGGVENRTNQCREKGDSTNARWSSDSLARNGKLSTITAEGVRVRVLLPCDLNELATSPLLPKSIYETGEELFPTTDFDALRKEAEGALAISRQAEWNPQRVAFHYGIDHGMLRYNRVEGLSAGVLADIVLGKGYDASAQFRIGTAAFKPYGEASIRRASGFTEFRAGAFHRLGTANDWGYPLGVGASVSALLFARDDGFYYNASGAELGGATQSTRGALKVSWRVFGEYHSTASVGTQGSLLHAINGTEFNPNVVADRGAYWGAAGTTSYSWGLDPRGTRVFGNTRLEAATGAVSYTRGMSELTMQRGLAKTAQLSLTASAGTSAGTLPQQRNWFLGGQYTVHAQRAGSASGNSFWLGRSELTFGSPMVRPVVFADIGWAGSRSDWTHSTHALSGAGAGASIFDGILRFDVSHGIRPSKGWRVDFYFEIR